MSKITSAFYNMIARHGDTGVWCISIETLTSTRRKTKQEIRVL